MIRSVVVMVALMAAAATSERLHAEDARSDELWGSTIALWNDEIALHAARHMRSKATSFSPTIRNSRWKNRFKIGRPGSHKGM